MKRFASQSELLRYSMQMGKEKFDDTGNLLDLSLTTNRVYNRNFIQMILNYGEVEDFVDGCWVSVTHQGVNSAHIFGDEDTARHCVRTGFSSLKTGVEIRGRDRAYRRILSDDYILEMFTAACFHDVGKRQIDQRLINKNDRLSPKEKAAIGEHEINSVVITENPFSADVPKMIGYHHMFKEMGLKILEKDGTGAPFASYIIAACDIFDAQVTGRPYRKRVITPAEALESLKKEKIPSAIVNAFIRNVVADIEFTRRVYKGTEAECHFT